MKAKELMIGDLVYCTYWPQKRIERVWELKRVADDELKVVVMDEVPLVFHERYIEPIPLTAEILEQNGFVTKDKPDHWTGYRSYTYKYSEGPTGLTFRLFHATGKYEWSGKCEISLNSLPYCIRFEYLHELQHILKICGIDKEIKLEE